MKIGIRYETVYRYDRAVRFSPHDVRLFPRSDRFVQIARLDFKTKPETAVRFGRDV
ncbi:MAG: transglutaminase family protein, partial [Verrucomicrobia bacterium]